MERVDAGILWVICWPWQHNHDMGWLALANLHRGPVHAPCHVHYTKWWVSHRGYVFPLESADGVIWPQICNLHIEGLTDFGVWGALQPS